MSKLVYCTDCEDWTEMYECTNRLGPGEMDEWEQLVTERDNLWMAYLHAQRCFYGTLRAEDKNELAHKDVDKAVRGLGPVDKYSLDIAKKSGRLCTAAKGD